MSYSNWTVEDSTGGGYSGWSVEGAEPKVTPEITPEARTDMAISEVPIPGPLMPSMYDPNMGADIYPGLDRSFKKTAIDTGYKLWGGAEAAMSTLSGLAATSAAGIAATGKTFDNMIRKGMSFEESLQDASSLLETIPGFLTYQPMSHYGKEYTENVMKLSEIPREIGELLGDDILYYLNGQAQLMKITPNMPQYGLQAIRLPDIMGPEYVEAVKKSGVDTSKFLMGAYKFVVLNNMALSENHRRWVKENFPEGAMLPPEATAAIASVIGIPTELYIWGKAFKLTHGKTPKFKGITQEQFAAREQLLKGMEERGEIPKGTTKQFEEAAKIVAEDAIDNGLGEEHTKVVEREAVNQLAKDARTVIEDPTMREILGLTDERIEASRKLQHLLDSRKKSVVARAELGTLENPTTFYQEAETGIEAWQDIANKARKPIRVIDGENEVLYYPEPLKEKVTFVTDEEVLKQMKRFEEPEKYAPKDEFADTELFEPGTLPYKNLKESEVNLKEDIVSWLTGKSKKMPKPSTLYRGGEIPESPEGFVHVSPWPSVAGRAGKFGSPHDVPIRTIPYSEDTLFYRGGSLSGDPLESTRILNAKGMSWKELMNEAKKLYEIEVTRSKVPEEAADKVIRDIINASFEADLKNKPGIWRGPLKDIPSELNRPRPKLRSNDQLVEAVREKRQIGFDDEDIPELEILKRQGIDVPKEEVKPEEPRRKVLSAEKKEGGTVDVIEEPTGPAGRELTTPEEIKQGIEEFFGGGRKATADDLRNKINKLKKNLGKKGVNQTRIKQEISLLEYGIKELSKTAEPAKVTKSTSVQKINKAEEAPGNEVITSLRGETGGKGTSLASEGEGLYVTQDTELASMFGDVKEVRHLKPRNPLRVEGAEELLLDTQEPEIFLEPVRSSDSVWLRINKEALKEAGIKDVSQFPMNKSQEKVFTKSLTKKIKDLGYDAVQVEDLKGDVYWTVLLDDSLIIKPTEPKATVPKKTRKASVIKARGQKNYKTDTGVIKRLTRDYGEDWRDEYWIQGDKETGYWAERIPESKNASLAAQEVLKEMGIDKPTPRQITNAERIARMKMAEETSTYLPNDSTGDPHLFSYEEKMFNLEMALKRASRESEGLRVEYFKDQFKQLADEGVFTKAELDRVNEMSNSDILVNMDYPDMDTAKLLARDIGIDEPTPIGTVGSEQVKDIVEFTKDIMSDEGGFINLSREDLMASVDRLKDRVSGYMREKFYDRPNVRSITYSNVFNAIEDFRITQNLGAFDAQLLRSMLFNKIPDIETAKKISNYLEGKKVDLEPKDVVIAEVIRGVYDQLALELQAEGILNLFLDNYVNHVLRPTGKGGKYTTKQAISFIKERVRKEGTKGTLTLEKLKEIGKEKGFEVEEDIRTLLPMYFYNAKRALARKTFANYMVTAETPDGSRVMYPTDKVPEEVANQYIDMVDVTPIKKWSRFHRRSTGLEDPEFVKERNRLFKSDVSVHRDAWKQIENLLAEEKSSAMTMWDASRGFVKRLIMFNPLIHGFNVESNVLLSQGVWEYLGARKGRPGRLEGMFGEANRAELNATMRRMVENGVQLEGLYKVGVRLAKDATELRLDSMSMKEWLNNVISNPSRAIHPLDWWGRVKTVGQINDIILWDRIVKTGQIAIYRSLEAKYLRQGYTPKEAGRMAAMQANDYMGTIPKTWFTKKQRTFLRKLLFARDWNVGLWRSLTGAAPWEMGRSGLTPKPLRFEGITPEMMGGIKGKGNPFKGIKGQYREMLIRGAIYITAFNNAVQMGLLAANDQELRPTWKNEKGHLLDIDTGTLDAKDQKVYLRGWLFRQISEYAHLAAAAVEGDIDKAAKVARNKLEPLLNLMIGTLFNIDYMNEPIRHPGATGPEKVIETLRFAAETITPVDTVFGRRGEVRNMWEVIAPLTGTFVRHGMPAGGDVEMANMLYDYYEWLDKQKYRNIVEAGDVEEMIRRGEWDESLDYVVAAVYSGHMTTSQFENLLRRNPQWGHALFGRVLTPDGKLEANAQKFLNDMGENEPEKFDRYYTRLKEIGDEVAKRGLNPIPETTKTQAKLEIFRLVMSKEKGYVHHPDDPGGETIYGVSRRWHPDWQGWKRVDFLKKQGMKDYQINQDARLKQYAGQFYNQYWEDHGIDVIKDPQLQELMFEFMFNTPTGATSSARKALGIGSKKTNNISSDLEKALNKLNTPEQKREFIRKFSEEMKRHYNINSPSSHLKGLHNKVDYAKSRYSG